MGGVQVVRGEGRKMGGEVSVQSTVEVEKDFCPNCLQPFLENMDRRSCNDVAGSLFSISQPSPKMPTVSFGGGSHLGVPCRGALSGRVEQEEGKTSSDQYPKAPRIS